MISVQDIILGVEYGLALCAIPTGTALLVGLFWRVIHIMA